MSVIQTRLRLLVPVNRARPHTFNSFALATLRSIDNRSFSAALDSFQGTSSKHSAQTEDAPLAIMSHSLTMRSKAWMNARTESVMLWGTSMISGLETTVRRALRLATKRGRNFAALFLMATSDFALAAAALAEAFALALASVRSRRVLIRIEAGLSAAGCGVGGGVGDDEELSSSEEDDDERAGALLCGVGGAAKAFGEPAPVVRRFFWLTSVSLLLRLLARVGLGFDHHAIAPPQLVVPADVLLLGVLADAVHVETFRRPSLQRQELAPSRVLALLLFLQGNQKRHP